MGIFLIHQYVCLIAVTFTFLCYVVLSLVTRGTEGRSGQMREDKEQECFLKQTNMILTLLFPASSPSHPLSQTQSTILCNGVAILSQRLVCSMSLVILDRRHKLLQSGHWQNNKHWLFLLHDRKPQQLGGTCRSVTLYTSMVDTKTKISAHTDVKSAITTDFAQG